MFIRFDTTRKRGRQTHTQTDRQTQRHRMTAKAAPMHSIALQKSNRNITCMPISLFDYRRIVIFFDYRRIVIFLIIAPYKFTHLLTYLLTYLNEQA